MDSGNPQPINLSSQIGNPHLNLINLIGLTPVHPLLPNFKK